MSVSYSWRGFFSNALLNALHAEAFHHRILQDDWWTQVNQHSLGWVCAEERDDLVGFVNVAWDGGIHAFLLDTMVTARLQRLGIGTEMIAIAIREAQAAGCEWVHVDFEDSLRSYYFDRCGFRPTNAGLIALK
jgi:GNAT superfamily N-acetyltransferase